MKIGNRDSGKKEVNKTEEARRRMKWSRRHDLQEKELHKNMPRWQKELWGIIDKFKDQPKSFYRYVEQ